MQAAGLHQISALFLAVGQMYELLLWGCPTPLLFQWVQSAVDKAIKCIRSSTQEMHGSVAA